jgi:hypothetical protein
MTAMRSMIADLLTECDFHGVRLTLTVDDRLEIEAPQDALTPELLMRLKTHKSELIACIERLEERAAIMEYDGGLSRSESELFSRRDCFT